MAMSGFVLLAHASEARSGQQARGLMAHSDPEICHRKLPLFPSPETVQYCCAIQGPNAGCVDRLQGSEHVNLLPRVAVHQMCEAFGIVVPDYSDPQGGIALSVLEARLSDSTPAAANFWAALGAGADMSVKVPSACMAVVRGLAALSAPMVPPPAAAAAPVSALTTAQIFERVFGGFAGAERTKSEKLTMQILFLDNLLSNNEAAIGASAFDDVAKRWIDSRAADLVGTLLGAPYTDTGELLRMVVATKGPKDSSGGGGRFGSKPAGDGGSSGDSSSSSNGLLAAASDTTKLPEATCEDGHARVVPLPMGMLPTAQAELLVLVGNLW